MSSRGTEPGRSPEIECCAAFQLREPDLQFNRRQSVHFDRSHIVYFTL